MDFVKVLESLENLVFEVAMWVIFVPKTLLKAVFRPNWIWAYASGELQKDKSKRYDDYLSPLLFWLVVAVIPNVIFAESVTSNTVSYAFLSNFADITKAGLDVKAGIIALSIVGTPLLFTVLLQLARKQPFTKSSLEPIFHAQCLCNGPLQLGILVSGLVDPLSGSGMLVAILALVPRLWFVIAEGWVYKEVLQTHWVKPFLIAVFVVIVLTLIALGLQFAS